MSRLIHVRALGWYATGQMWVETLVLREEDVTPALKHEFPDATRFSPVHTSQLPALTTYTHLCSFGWVCEQHPERGWPEDDPGCPGPGMPCAAEPCSYWPDAA